MIIALVPLNNSMELMVYKVGRKTWFKCECDICGSTYDNTKIKENYRKKGVIANGRNLCFECVSKESKKRLVKAGTKALKSIPPEEKRKICSQAGKKAALSPNSGRFTTEKWKAMSEEDQKLQVTRASAALQKKLKNDHEYRKKHYTKLFKQLKIGYVSKAHQELHDEIKDLGYIMHHIISPCCVDECHPDLKIVIEYNGDYWHCNPETWKENDYNKAIKMYAKDKWRSDFKRIMALKREGYLVIVVWESEWRSDKEKVISYIKRKTEEIKERIKD